MPGLSGLSNQSCERSFVLRQSIVHSIAPGDWHDRSEFLEGKPGRHRLRPLDRADLGV
jgi:hypothetical protein